MFNWEGTFVWSEFSLACTLSGGYAFPSVATMDSYGLHRARKLPHCLQECFWFLNISLTLSALMGSLHSVCNTTGTGYWIDMKQDILGKKLHIHTTLHELYEKKEYGKQKLEAKMFILGTLGWSTVSSEPRHKERGPPSAWEDFFVCWFCLRSVIMHCLHREIVTLLILFCNLSLKRVCHFQVNVNIVFSHTIF